MSLLLLLGAVVAAPYGTQPDAVDAYLADLARENLTYPERVAVVARDAVGTEYRDGPLGEGPGGTYDSDPLIDLTCADCVTYVEQCLALAASANYKEATDKLQQIRYAGGAVDFATRNHFMVADWLAENAWCVEQTKALGVPVAQVTRTISKRDFFQRVKAPGLGNDVADRDVTVNYIPVAQAGGAAAAIKQPSLIVFIGKIDWLFALHCGLFLPDENGGLLYHASSKAGAVTPVKLADYVASQPKRYLGFTVHEITAPPFAEPVGKAAK